MWEIGKNGFATDGEDKIFCDTLPETPWGTPVAVIATIGKKGFKVLKKFRYEAQAKAFIKKLVVALNANDYNKINELKAEFD